jgi:uncharacterized protein (TIGR02466 family)
MNHQVIPLFSVPLFKSNIGQLDVITMAWVKNLQYPLQAVGHDGSDDHLPKHKQGMHILHNKKLRKLKALIQQSIDYFAHEVLDIEDHINFEIQASWINKIDTSTSVKNDIVSHGHAGSMISGVYYIDADSTTAPITFEKAYMYPNLFHNCVPVTYKKKNFNQYNVQEFTTNPVTGDILLFPSHLQHKVERADSKKDRYGIAFNCFAKGDIGYGSAQITL